MRSIDEILDGAADLYDSGKIEWLQFRSQDGLGGACMGRAVFMASDRAVLGTNENFENFHTVSRFVSPYLGTSIPGWNDKPGRTKQEVVDKLRELAKRYREETQR